MQFLRIFFYLRAPWRIPPLLYGQVDFFPLPSAFQLGVGTALTRPGLGALRGRPAGHPGGQRRLHGGLLPDPGTGRSLPGPSSHRAAPHPSHPSAIVNGAATEGQPANRPPSTSLSGEILDIHTS